MELRLKGLLITIIELLRKKPEEYVVDYIKNSLIDYVLSISEIVALINGFQSWYVAEQNAIACFEAF